jgi:hypothetical protein
MRGIARTTFAIEQHHRQVVLTERMAALRGGPEVTPSLDMIAHEPRWPALHKIHV